MLVKNKNSNTILMVVVGFAVILMISIVIAIIVISTRQAQIPQSIDGNSNSSINTSDSNSSSDAQDDTDNSTNDDNGLATNDLTGEISYKAIVASVLQLRVSINSHITSGNCFLTMTGPNKQTYTEQADIIANSNRTATCSGFDIPISTLSQLDKDSKNLNGKWTIKIHLQTKGHTGDINSEVTL